MHFSHNMTLCARASYEAMPLPRTTIGVLPPNFHGGHLATNYQNYDWGLAAKFSLRGLPAALGHAHQPCEFCFSSCAICLVHLLHDEPTSLMSLSICFIIVSWLAITISIFASCLAIAASIFSSRKVRLLCTLCVVWYDISCFQTNMSNFFCVEISRARVR